jgi:hypothetical protein
MPAKQQPDESSVSETPASDTPPPKLRVELVNKESRSNQFWLATLGIVSTMVVGVVGAFLAWYTGKQHDEQETMRQTASFTRSQQLDAYTAFDSAIAKFEDSVNTEERLYTAPYEGADTHLGPRSKQDFATSFNNLLKAGSKVIFCGSKEVGKAQVEVMNEASEIHDALRRFEDSHPVNANPQFCK